MRTKWNKIIPIDSTDALARYYHFNHFFHPSRAINPAFSTTASYRVGLRARACVRAGVYVCGARAADKTYVHTVY